MLVVQALFVIINHKVINKYLITEEVEFIMNWLIIIALTVSSSIDNLGVGLSYGIRKVNIRIDKNILIAVICFFFSYAGISFGLWIASILPGILPLVVGAFLLLIIGIRIILLANTDKSKTDHSKEKGRYKEKLQVNKFDTLSELEEIGWGESIVLGIVLSANALTNGVGAGLIGLSPWLISFLAAAGSFVTVWAGVRLGSRLADVKIGSYTVGQFGTILSGALIVLVAIMIFF